MTAFQDVPDWFDKVASSFALHGKAFVVRIPRGVTSERRLFAIFARELQFPGYFGWNWDAFEECLRDLSWLGDNPEVMIVHEDIPFPRPSCQRTTYLDVLHSVCSDAANIHCVSRAATETA